MSESQDPSFLESPTLRAHKRQRVWQILVPMVGVTFLLLAAAIWLVSGGQSQTRLWADISLIWLLLPMLLLALLLALALGAAVYGMARLLRATPRFTARAQGLAEQAAGGVRRIADGAARPFIWLEQARAGFRSAVHFLLKKR